jgi:hypothetical protein
MPSQVQARFGTLDQYLTPEARERILVRAATLAIGLIKRRTGQGVGVDGGAFVPYSRRYAKQRSQSGRSASPPTLLLTGAMLGSMKVLQSDATRAVIGFSGSSARARFVKRKRALAERVSVKQGGGMGTLRTKTGRKITHAVSEQNAQVANALKAAWNDRGDGKIPRRHFFGLSAQDRRFLLRDAIGQIIAAVRDASFKRMSAAGALNRARLAK